MRIDTWLAGLLVATACTSAASAQSAADRSSGSNADNEPAMLEIAPIVVTATRERRRTTDVSAAVATVERKEIDRQVPSVVSDLLRATPGVFVQTNAPGQGAPIVRGMIGSGVLMLVDGMRLNTAFFRPTTNQYFALVDPYNVERIEVVREAGSTLYGSDAMGGVVQVFTPLPLFTGSDWEAHARGRALYQTAVESWTTRVGVEGGKQGITLRGGFTFQERGDVRGGRNTGVQSPSGYTSYAGDVKAFFETGRHDFLVSADYLRQPSTPRYDELTAGFGQTRPASSVFVFEPNDRLFLHGRYRFHRPFSGLDRLELHLGFQQIDDDRRSRAFGSPLEVTEQDRSRMLGGSVQLTTRWRDFMTFTYGLEAYVDRIRSAAQSRNIDTGASGVAPGRLADGSSLSTFAAYVQDEIRWHPVVTTVVGGRFSYFDIDVAQADRDVGTRFTPRDLTGSLGVIVRPHASVALLTNIGRGFRVPNVFDLSTLGARPGNRFVVPNPSLNPEQVITWDAGVRLVLPRFSAEVFGFYAWYRDKIEGLATGEVTDTGRTIVIPTNVSRTNYHGVEAAFRWRLRSRLSLTGTFTYTFADDLLPDGSIKPASRIPPVHGQVALLWEPTARFTLEAILRYYGTQDRLSPRDLTDTRMDPQGTIGRALAFVRMQWRVDERLTLRLDVENVFDQDLREHGSGINVPGTNVILGMDVGF
jgi:hemoglobin/transferrin/lactoferrin receptor protein